MRGNGTLRIVAPARGGETHHAIYPDRDGQFTYCGRDAFDWLEIGIQTFPAFLDSAYSCKRCARMVSE
jgi:hypothetical protein